MDKPPKRPRGRPAIPDPATVRINFRVTPAQRETYKAAARKAGVSLSVWLQTLADKES